MSKEIIKKFADHCDDCGYCFRCRFYSELSIGACLEAYLKKVHDGEMTLEDSFEEESK